jgi:hypothetical protein
MFSSYVNRLHRFIVLLADSVNLQCFCSQVANKSFDAQKLVYVVKTAGKKTEIGSLRANFAKLMKDIDLLSRLTHRCS